MTVPQLDLSAQYASLRQELEAAVLGVLRSQRFVLGQEGEALEREICCYTGAAHAVACGSGSDALLLALRALDIGPGDEVITTPFTFVATAAAIQRLGARPVFADVEADSLNLDADQVARRINSRTRAIVAVHLYGRLAGVEELAAIAAGCRIPLVEDAAQALGARREGRMAGVFGAVGCYSFYPTKNLGGAGDGGMMVTGDERLARRLRRLRHHGAEEPYRYAEVGLNSRLDEIQAAVLRVKLRRLEAWNAARRRHAGHYNRLLAGVVRTPELAGEAHIFHQYVIRTPERSRLRRHLGDRGVGTALYYPEPLHLQPAFAGLGHQPGDFPNAEAAAREALALPMYPELEPEAIEYVAASIRESAARPVAVQASSGGWNVRS